MKYDNYVCPRCGKKRIVVTDSHPRPRCSNCGFSGKDYCLHHNDQRGNNSGKECVVPLDDGKGHCQRCGEILTLFRGYYFGSPING